MLVLLIKKDTGSQHFRRQEFNSSEILPLCVCMHVHETECEGSEAIKSRVLDSGS